MALVEKEGSPLQNRDFRNHINRNWDALNEYEKNVAMQFVQFLNDPPKSTVDEITQARIDASGTEYPTMKPRIDAVQRVANAAYSAVLNKADKDYIDKYLAQINYMPETVASLTELKSKYPNGNPGLFITADNGHKYIWSESVWKDAGVYQAQGIGAESIDWQMIRQPLTKATIILGEIMIDTMSKTINATDDLALDVNFNYIYPNKQSTLVIPTSNEPLYYSVNRVSLEFSLKPISETKKSTNNEVLIGVLYGGVFYASGDKSNQHINYIGQKYRPNRKNGELVFGDFKVNYAENTITSSDNSIFACNGQLKKSEKNLSTKLPGNSDDVIIFVYYDFLNDKLVSVASADFLNTNLWYLFSIYRGEIFDTDSKHITFIDRNKLDERQPETSLMLFNDTFKVTLNEKSEKGTAHFPKGTCFYINSNGYYIRIINETTLEYDDPQSEVNVNGLLTFFFKPSDGSVYESHFKKNYNDISLFSIYGGKVYGVNHKGFIFNGIEDGGWFNTNTTSAKNLLFLGDSIMQGWDGGKTEPHNIPWHFSSQLGFTFQKNSAVGGATISDSSNSLVTQIKNADLLNVDYLIFNGGTNDYSNNITLENFESGFRYIATTVYSKNEKTQIYYIPPFFRSCNAARDKKENGYLSKNAIGFTLLDYLKRATELCEEYGIPFYESNKNTGWNMTTEATHLGDMLHPSELGYEVIGNKITSDFDSKI